MQSNSTFNKANWVAMKGLSLLKNSLAVAPYYNAEYSGEYAKKFAIGRTLTIPGPQRYLVQRNDMTYNPQALDRPPFTVNMDQTATIPFDWESVEKALDMERGEEIVEREYLKTAVAYIRQSIDVDLAQFAYQNTNMVVGTLGTAVTTYDATSGAALQALFEMGCPVEDGELGLFVPPAVNRAVKNTGQTFHNPVSDITKQFRTGFVGTSDSFDWYTSMSLASHTAGTWAGAVTVNGAGQSGSTLNVTCTTGDTFKKGDKISVANVNQVNLMTRVTTTTSSAGTKTFTILADATGVASAAALSIAPAIYAPGSHYQNVDALPAASAALTLWPGTSSPSAKSGKVGFGIYPGAFFLVGLPLEEPTSAEICKQYTDPKTGLSIRFIRDWDNTLSRMTNRMDCLWGRGVGLAEQGAVVLAAA